MDDRLATDEEYRQRIVAAMEDGDWYEAYVWTKSWIGRGGALLLDPWVAYVASSLLHGQPRTAVHSIDMALSTWIPRPGDRAVLLWMRSRVLRHRLRDPKVAMPDLLAAASSPPAWLAAEVSSDVEACEAECLRSRKRKPSVSAAPTFDESSHEHMVTVWSAERSLPDDGRQPVLWSVVLPYLVAPLGDGSS